MTLEQEMEYNVGSIPGYGDFKHVGESPLLLLLLLLLLLMLPPNPKPPLLLLLLSFSSCPSSSLDLVVS